MKGLPRGSIQKNCRSSRREDCIHPLQPLLPKTFCFHEGQHCLVFNFIECLFKINLDDDYLFLGMVTEVEVLKGPGQAILNCSRVNEPILISMYQLGNDGLKPIGQELCQELEGGVQQ